MTPSLTRILLLVALSSLIATPGALAQQVVFVNQAATGLNDGTSWADAFVFLQDALATSDGGAEIWIAAGAYYPDNGAGVQSMDRNASFIIPSGVSLYGGFDGSESSLDERDWLANETILSGDLLQNDDDVLTLDNPLRFDNSFHVVQMLDLTDKVILDGFTVSDGMAKGRATFRGAAIEIQIVEENPVLPGLIQILNNLFTNNVSEEAAVNISVEPSPAEPAVLIVDSEMRNNWGLTVAGIRVGSGRTLIRNVLFTENEAAVTGAIRVEQAIVYIVGSEISKNRALDQVVAGTGATLYMWNNVIAENVSFWSPVQSHDAEYVGVNNIFIGNSDAAWGSAIFVNGGEANIVNNVFAFNSGTGTGGVEESGSVVFSEYANTFVSNSIFWDNEAPSNSEIVNRVPDLGTVQVSNSLLQYALPLGVVDGGGLVTGDPLFVDPDGADNIPGTIDDDFRLTLGSPAIDAGANDSLFVDFFDIDGDGNTTEPWPADFDGNTRVFDGGSGIATVDMGAFEFDAPPVGTAIEGPALPEKPGLMLSPPFPNPFTQSTTIEFTLTEPSEISLTVYDVLGREVKRLVEASLPQGYYTYRFDPENLTQGLYFYRLRSGYREKTGKMIYVK